MSDFTIDKVRYFNDSEYAKQANEIISFEQLPTIFLLACLRHPIKFLRMMKQ
jgi:hypothetical protein